MKNDLKFFVIVVMLFLVIGVTCLSNATETYVYAVKDEMVLVKSGEFEMGGTVGEAMGYALPVHTVKLTYDFTISKTEITNEAYIAYLNDSDVDSEGESNGKDHISLRDSEWTGIVYKNDSFYLKEDKQQTPVVEVTWWGAIGYCNWLSEKEGFPKAYDDDGNLLDKNGRQTTDVSQVEGFRLPTEAEWEYAARGGHKSTRDYIFSGSDDLEEVGWYVQNSGDELLKAIMPEWGTIMENNNKPQQVGLKSPNRLGLYDMSGNVREWCQDWYEEFYYKNSPLENPVNLNKENGRVIRGGGWESPYFFCQIAYRDLLSKNPPDFGKFHIGFRIVRTH